MARGGQTAKDTTAPELKAAWERKEAGDVAGARREAERLLAGSLSPEDAALARELLAHTAAPPALFGYAGVAAAIFVLLVTLAAARY